MKKTESERMGELGWVRAALLIVLALLLHLIVSGCSEPGKATWDAGDWSMADAMPNCPESAAPPGGLAGSGCYAHECFNGCCQWVLAAEGAVCYQPHCTDTPGVCSSAEGTMQCIVSLDGGSVPVSTVDEALDLESLLLQGDHPCSIAQCTLAGAKLEDKCGSGDSGIPTPDGCFCPREFQVSVGAASQVDSKTLLTGDEALVALVEKNEEGKGRLLLRVFDTITTGKLAELSAPAGPNSDHTGFAWVPTGDGSDGDSGFLLAYMDNGVVYGWGVDWDTASAHLRTAAMPAELLPGVSNALEVDLALTDSGTVAALRYSGDKPDDGCARVVNLDAGLESPPVCHEGMTGMSLVSGQARIHLLLQMADGSAVVETFYDTLVPAATPILLGMKCEPDRPVAAAVFEGTFFATCRTSESTVVVEAFQPEVPGMKSSVDLGPGFDPTLRPLPPGMGGAPVGFMVMFGTTTVAGHCLRLARIEGNLTVDYMADPLPGTDSTRATPRLDFVYELAEPDLAVGGTYLRLPSGGAWYFASGADGTDSPLLPPVCAGKKCGDDGFGGSCGACEEGSVCQEGACIEQASPPCVPDCGGKECGDDGCEGVCGECDAGFVCKSGFCEDGGELPCDPDCEEKECGPDECGATCGECGEGLTCQDGICVEIECAADCEGKECGPDECGATCGECGEGLTCQDGICVEIECAADCEGKECGDDGCNGTCGECGAGSQCQQGQCVEIQVVCTPKCDGKECGPDGCTGTCGSCPLGHSCSVAGLCACDKQCTGKTCGPDGCGGLCGTCLDGFECSKGQCQKECDPDCWGRVCGDDGCGNPCGSCQYGYTCTPAGKCQCQAQCSGKQCGPDGCGGTCGSCSYGYSCTASGKCQCQAQCGGKQCGPDGCGDVCGTCSYGYSCSGAGICVCNKQCAGKQCGPDGCGGVCGVCGSGSTCNGSGQCEPTCVATDKKQCVGGSLFSMDSCGKVGDLVQTCSYCCDGDHCSGECAPFKTKSCTMGGCQGERECTTSCQWGDCEPTQPPNACGGCADLASEPDTACGASVPFISERGCWQCMGTDSVECTYPDCAYCATACAAVKVTGCGIGAGAPCALAGLTGVGALLCPVIVGAICDGMMGAIGACDSTCAMVGWCPPDGSCKE